ncbi:MAG: Rieske 2Fe-2S domain-containing protein [Betaproteobacteria bacterium]|nr:Rieske 2Fe-2S domain-containing protein [Betaproteobacteria bacterium]
MSKALDYLVKARPEAMTHYFSFLKDAGSKLEPKTRSLISVITKVHAQTERGLKQYVKRALNDGASAAEILDALLMAFPALGLAKIVWAVDVLLEAGMPEFSLEALGAKPEWHRLGEAETFREGSMTRVELAGRNVLVTRTKGEIAVYDTHCPHQRTPIPLEALAGGKLKCPKHGWTFDIASGACTSGGERPLKRYESKVEAGGVLAYW